MNEEIASETKSEKVAWKTGGSQERMVPKKAGQEQFQEANKFKYSKSQVKSGLKRIHQAWQLSSHCSPAVWVGQQEDQPNGYAELPARYTRDDENRKAFKDTLIEGWDDQKRTQITGTVLWCVLF